MKFATVTVTCTGTNAIRGDRRLAMEGPTGAHSVLLREPGTDEYVGLRRARAAIHLIGYLERNHVALPEIGRAVTHVLQDTIEGFGAADTFIHAEYRRGLLAAWGIGRRTRKGSETHEAAGYRAGKLLRGYVDLPLAA